MQPPPGVVVMGDPRVTSIPAMDCGEPLVDVRRLGLLVREDPAPKQPRCHLLRRSVAERLREGQGHLPPGYRLMVVEGYRPHLVQEQAFRRHHDRLAQADPSLSEEEVFLTASQFVSPPAVAPHVSGAAVDLTLINAAGAPLDMGTEVDATPEESDGACYFAAPNISVAGRRHREILAVALVAAGLVNYPTEWWHWSFGDRYWALTTGAAEAVYGPVDDRAAIG